MNRIEKNRIAMVKNRIASNRKVKKSLHPYLFNQNYLNNFGRGPPRDHSCEGWSKSNDWFQRRCLSKNVYARRTMHDGRRTTTNDGQRPLCSGELKCENLRTVQDGDCLYTFVVNAECFVSPPWYKKIPLASKLLNSSSDAVYSITYRIVFVRLTYNSSPIRHTDATKMVLFSSYYTSDTCSMGGTENHVEYIYLTFLHCSCLK